MAAAAIRCPRGRAVCPRVPQHGCIPFWWVPVAVSTAVRPIFRLLLARVSGPSIGVEHSSRKAPTELQTDKCLIGILAHQFWTHVLTHQIWVHGGTLMYPPTPLLFWVGAGCSPGWDFFYVSTTCFSIFAHCSSGSECCLENRMRRP